jgi:hypothetical protein
VYRMRARGSDRGPSCDYGGVNGCEILQGRPLQLLRTLGCGAEPLATLSLSGLRKFSTACMNPKAFKDDFPDG